jgi:uncharacterized protein
MPEFHARSLLPVSAAEAFAWHDRPGAFARLSPPWDRVEVLENPGHIRSGARVLLRVKTGPIWQRWLAEHRDYVKGRLFRDVQLEGPFAEWDHRHNFLEETPTSCTLHDHIGYRVPLGRLGRTLGGAFVRGKLSAMFGYRHAVTLGDLRMHARHAHLPRQRVLISGSSGVIGRQLSAMLSTGGHEVIRLVRPPQASSPGCVAWDPFAGTIDRRALLDAGPTAVIHLAGAPVADRRWTSAVKQHILESRVRATEALARELALLAEPPSVLVSASAVGIYGSQPDDRLLTESSPIAPAGAGFRSDVCRAWEAATEPSRRAGIRTVCARIGLVLTPGGGLLQKFLPIHAAAVGADLGRGTQFWPVIGLDDCLDALVECMLNRELSGPVNIVGWSLPQAEFSRTLARVLGRPRLGYAPEWLVRMIAGEMTSGLFESQNIAPSQLQSAGLPLRAPNLEAALATMLGRRTLADGAGLA